MLALLLLARKWLLLSELHPRTIATGTVALLLLARK
jgi:hypothetical protein